MAWYREEYYLDGVRDGPWTSIASNGERTMSYYISGVRVPDPWTMDTVEACVYRLNHSPDPEVRLEAAMTLIQHGVDATWAVGDLVRALDDTDQRVVREVTVALGIIGEDAGEAIGRLSQLAGEPDRQVAEAARAALRQMEQPHSPHR